MSAATLFRPGCGTTGRNWLVVVGIDAYRRWTSLTNAVRDAMGARALFQQLGFEEVRPALLDGDATGAALRALVVDDLRTLGPDDSLILFYAGHGGSQNHDQDGGTIQTGYLIPVDAEPDRISTWIDLEGWLRSVALLPARHILVILDACHAGVALDPVIKWRDNLAARSAPLETLQRRRSRRVITSALGDERAADSGPVPGHSLFTGCLIEALTGGLRNPRGRVTGSEIAVWVQNRVRNYPSVQQTPDFGVFAQDNRGEIVIPLLAAAPRDAADLAADAAMPAFAPAIDAAVAIEVRTITSAPPAPPRPGALASAFARLRRDADWLMIAAPLLAIGVAGVIARSC